ncbi:MAG: hypothetical protein NTU59_02160 [Coprothermobacterota bacterium]|nr:hypothetical protein [Coprothermobacterota bacterium]
MKITIHGGVGEIGGNKILLEDGKTRIWLDFGASFEGSGGYYVDWLKPRNVYGLLDHFEFGLLPKLKGLYPGRWPTPGICACTARPAT